MIDFVYEETIQNNLDKGLWKLLCKNPLYEVRGLTLKTGEMYINLSATLWKLSDVDFVIKQLSKTIIHEQIHNLFINDNYDAIGEENICNIMADQGMLIAQNLTKGTETEFF